MRIRHHAGSGPVLRLPLMCAGRALSQLPVILEQVLEEVVAPLRRRRGPGDFQAAADGVVAVPAAIRVLPTHALLLDRRTLGLRPDILARIRCTVGLAEAMPARNERNGFLV